MKNFNYKILSGLLILVLFITSCELTDVTDIDPVYKISEINAITNLDQAQTVLTGTYGILINGEEFVTDMPALTAMMGLSMKPGRFGNKFEIQFFKNDVSTENYRLDGIYIKLYSVLNNANHVISKTEKLETSNLRKQEIIAEAKTLRALSHFYLLRLWGEFYDLNSENGIVLKLEPNADVEPTPKNSVMEVYDSVLNDLEYAIENGPQFTSSLYTSALFAKALKSKVLLFKKDYQPAAALALEVIESNKRTLESNFGDIFTKKTTNPSEVLFQTPFDKLNDRNNKTFFYTYVYTLSDNYIQELAADPRKDAAITSLGGAPRNNKFVDPVGVQNPDTDYVLRLAEVYLIYAEAVLRGNNDIIESQNALNIIRERVDKSPIEISDKDLLLEEIRNEKFLELGAENGEEWFDLVRYYKEGDLDINDFKPLVSDSRLILPFPYKTIFVSNNTLIQNTGY